MKGSIINMFELDQHKSEVLEARKMRMFKRVSGLLTLPISFAPNHAVSAPCGGGMTLNPFDI
jgi:hypothetical protein